MTQFVTYGGVDIAGHIKLPEGITGMTSHADGTYGAGSALIDDGAGIFNLVSLQEFIHEEDACSQPRTFTGFLVQRRLSRGVQVPGSGRDHDLDIVDLNYLLHLQPLRGATAKRPVETGDDRMDWLMASVALDGIVFDNGLIGSNTNLFDEADYTLQYADDVLQDLSVSSSAEVGRIFFVRYDPTSGEPTLFMDRPTATTLTSTLSISNDLSDLSSTCFPPYMDAELQSSGEDIYCSVFFKYKTGTVFRHNDTTHATYFASKGYHRQGVFETTRVGSEDTAIRHADAWLANHSGDLDTITCQIQLPADKVNLIEAGMRVQCKFTHFPGYDTFGYLRVSSRTVGLEPVNDLYLVRLVLSNRTLTPAGTGSGSTGDFPHPPTRTSVVQTGCGHALAGAIVLSFPAAVAAGDMLVAWVVARAGGPGSITPPTGWTEIDEEAVNAGASPAVMFYKVADSSDDGLTDFAFTVGGGSSRPKGLIWELSGVAAPTHSVTVPNATGSTSFSFPSLTEGAGISIIGVGTGSDDPAPATITPSDHTYIEAGDNFWQTAVGADRLVTGGSQVYAATFTVNGGGSDYCGVAAFFPADSEGDPPTSGQEVGPETVTMSGPDGTTAFPFATGSLRVYVDNTDQTAAITAQDGATGTFTLGFTPTPTETVVVFYQGL